MPFAFITIGLILVICAARGTAGQLGTLLKGDFTGDRNFFYWVAAIGVVGSIGYIQKAQNFSRAFLSLILIALILSNKGFFQKLQDAIKELSGSNSTGSGSAGNTLDNAQAAPQTPGAGAPGSGGSNNSNPYSAGGLADYGMRTLLPRTLDNIVESGGIGF